MARNKVLVVDDEKNQREIYMMILEDAGYSVTTAQNKELELSIKPDEFVEFYKATWR